MSKLSDKFNYYLIRDPGGDLEGHRTRDLPEYPPTGSYFFLNERSDGILPPTNATFNLKER